MCSIGGFIKKNDSEIILNSEVGVLNMNHGIKSIE